VFGTKKKIKKNKKTVGSDESNKVFLIFGGGGALSIKPATAVGPHECRFALLRARALDDFFFLPIRNPGIASGVLLCSFLSSTGQIECVRRQSASWVRAYSFPLQDADVMRCQSDVV